MLQHCPMHVTALLLLTATLATAQFKSTATLVIAPTTVTGVHGEPVDGLDPDDLVLYDNGVRQPIQVDESYNPISLVVAVQTSSNSAAVLDKLGSSGLLLGNLLAGDRGEIAVVTFSDDVQTRRDFTANFTSVTNALAPLHVQGTGAVALDAVMQSLAMLATRQSDRRRILLVIAEKRDRSSKLKFPTVLAAAQRQNVLIYWLTYSPFLQPFTARPKQPPEMAPGSLIDIFTEISQAEKPDNSAILTRTTGGRAINFLKKDALEEAIQAIGAEVHRQYIVSFAPRPGKAGEYHTIHVQVKGRKDLTARTREGYWSVP
jgi:VWFA-related protein